MKKLIITTIIILSYLVALGQLSDTDKVHNTMQYVVDFYPTYNNEKDNMGEFATIGSTVNLKNVLKSVKNNRVAEAADMIGLIKKNDKNESQYDYAMALIKYENGDYQTAMRLLDNSIKLDAQASKYFYRGLFKTNLNLYNSAVDDLQQAMQLDATLEEEASKQLMQAYFADNNYGQAFKYAEMYGNNNPNKLKPYLIKAQVYILQNKHEGAIGEIDQALKYHSSNGKLHALKGSALQKLEKHDEACQSFDTAEKFGFETKSYDKSKCQ